VKAVGAAIAIAVVLASCGHTEDARYPSRPAGCDVKLYPGLPDVPTDNIGPVRAKCDPDVSKDDCLRTLKDQACKLGADVIWQADVEPSQENGKNAWYGRAAHTAPPKKPAAP
jgi:hypothetical protein